MTNKISKNHFQQMIIVINDQMKPIFAPYFLHIQQGHSSVTQFEVLDLNVE